MRITYIFFLVGIILLAFITGAFNDITDFSLPNISGDKRMMVLFPGIIFLAGVWFPRYLIGKIDKEAPLAKKFKDYIRALQIKWGCVELTAILFYILFGAEARVFVLLFVVYMLMQFPMEARVRSDLDIHRREKSNYNKKESSNFV